MREKRSISFVRYDYHSFLRLNLREYLFPSDTISECSTLVSAFTRYGSSAAHVALASLLLFTAGGGWRIV